MTTLAPTEPGRFVRGTRNWLNPSDMCVCVCVCVRVLKKWTRKRRLMFLQTRDKVRLLSVQGKPPLGTKLLQLLEGFGAFHVVLNVDDGILV